MICGQYQLTWKISSNFPEWKHFLNTSFHFSSLNWQKKLVSSFSRFFFKWFICLFYTSYTKLQHKPSVLCFIWRLDVIRGTVGLINICLNGRLQRTSILYLYKTTLNWIDCNSKHPFLWRETEDPDSIGGLKAQTFPKRTLPTGKNAKPGRKNVLFSSQRSSFWRGFAGKLTIWRRISFCFWFRWL